MLSGGKPGFSHGLHSCVPWVLSGLLSRGDLPSSCPRALVDLVRDRFEMLSGEAAA